MLILIENWSSVDEFCKLKLKLGRGLALKVAKPPRREIVLTLIEGAIKSTCPGNRLTCITGSFNVFMLTILCKKLPLTPPKMVCSVPTPAILANALIEPIL